MGAKCVVDGDTVTNHDEEGVARESLDVVETVVQHFLQVYHPIMGEGEKNAEEASPSPNTSSSKLVQWALIRNEDLIRFRFGNGTEKGKVGENRGTGGN